MDHNGFIEFGDFSFDREGRQLFREGRAVSITPKALHLLEILITNRGKVVDKDFLIGEIWKDSFVEEGNLAYTANSLRKVLGDVARSPVYIETVPRRGYRFIGVLTHSNGTGYGNTEPAVKVRDADRSAKRTTILRPAIVFVLAAATLSALLAWYLWSGASSESRATVANSKLLAEKLTNSGNVEEAAISPDGLSMVYVDRSGDLQTVWLRNLATTDSRQLLPPTPDRHVNAAFSGDGNSIYLTRRPRGGGSAETTLLKIALGGGVPSKLAENFDYAEVSRDESRMSLVRCQPQECSILVSSIDGSNEKVIRSSRAQRSLGKPRFSPDGMRLAVVMNGTSIAVLDAQTGDELSTSPRKFFDIAGIDWMPDARTIVFSAQESLDAKSSLWRFDLTNNVCSRLNDDPNNYFRVSISRKGDKILATQVSNDFGLYVPSPEGERYLAAAREFTFTPEGKLIYVADDGNLWAMNQDGSSQQQLTNDAGVDFSPRVSPDGRSIYFTSNRTGNNSIWKMNADGVEQRQITESDHGYPRLVTADNKLLYYLSSRDHRLWSVSTETLQQTKVVDEPLISPEISPDGEMIAHLVKNKVWQINVIRIADGRILKIIDFPEGHTYTHRLSWRPDNRTINFVAKKGGKNILWQQSIDGGGPTSVGDLGPAGIEYLAVSPNGSYAFTRGRWIHDAVLMTAAE